MKILPEELPEHQYVLLDKLNHNELMSFVQLYLKKIIRFSILYTTLNVLAFMLVIFFFVRETATGANSFGEKFSYFSYGIAMTILLVPIHEYIHVLAYKSQGATNTSYDANWKKFYFMALADQFVANRKEFQIVALAPITVISFILILLMPFVNPEWRLALSATLLAHTAMCSGDFALLSYFDFHKNKQIVTYDDIGKKESYFYELVNREEDAANIPDIRE